MALNISATPEKKVYEPAPVGVHVGRCASIIDLGTQTETFQGETKDRRKVLIQWELAEVRTTFTKDGEEQDQPKVVSKEYTLSLNEKANLRKTLDAWRGRPFNEEELKSFDLHSIIGASCLVQIQHRVAVSSGNTYAVVSSIMALPKSQTAPNAELPAIVYSVDDEEVPQGLPHWILEKIYASKELEGKPLPVPAEGVEQPLKDPDPLALPF